MYSKLSNILNDINTIMMPRLCFGCNARLYRGEHLLCTFCRNQLPLTEYNLTDENAVDRIFYGRIDIKKAAALLYYEEHGIVKNLIHYLKYKNQQPIGIFLGDWFGELIKKEGELHQIDVVIPVPLHKIKLRKRGYNQVAEFGKRMAFHLGAAYMDTFLSKRQTRKHRPKRTGFTAGKGAEELYRLSDPGLIKNTRISVG